MIPPPPIAASRTPMEMISAPLVSNVVKTGDILLKRLCVGKPLIMSLRIPMSMPAVVAVKPLDPEMDVPLATDEAGRKP